MWDVWIKTCLLAIADPFSICNRKLECRPERYSLVEKTGDLLDMKEDKEAILTVLGARSAILSFLASP